MATPSNVSAMGAGSGEAISVGVISMVGATLASKLGASTSTAGSTISTSASAGFFCSLWAGAGGRRAGRGGQPRGDLREQTIAPFFRLGNLPLEQFDETMVLSGARRGQPALRVGKLAAKVLQ